MTRIDAVNRNSPSPLGRTLTLQLLGLVGKEKEHQDPDTRADLLIDRRYAYMAELFRLEIDAAAECRRCWKGSKFQASEALIELELDIEFCCRAIESIPAVAAMLRQGTITTPGKSGGNLDTITRQRINARKAAS